MEEVKYILPEDFDGIVRFTNVTEEDFVGVWAGKSYTFPSQKMTPIVIPECSPLELLSIRKKFAKELAEREFFKSQRYESLRKIEGDPMNPRLNSIHSAGSYTDKDLATMIQSCLEPLPIGQAKVAELPKENLESKLTRDDEGELVTVAIDKKTSLKKRALEK